MSFFFSMLCFLTARGFTILAEDSSSVYLNTSPSKTVVEFRGEKHLFSPVRQPRNPNSSVSCSFIGVESTRPSNLLQFSDCAHLSDGWMSINGDITQFQLKRTAKAGTFNLSIIEPLKIDADGTIGIGGEQMIEEPEQEISDFPWKEGELARWWDFERGELVVGNGTERIIDFAKLTDEQKEAFLKWQSQFWQVSEEFEAENFGVSRPKRGIEVTSTEKYLELAIVVDKGLWDLYVSRYGSEAEAALNSFIDAVVDTAQILWQHESISPTINFKISSLTIWKTQPDSLRITTGSDAIQYLRDSCLFFRPKAAGVDHVAVITGYDVRLGGNAIGGLSFTSAVCSDASCSMINAGRSGFRAGFTLAHEIGHSVSMKHDGDSRYQETQDCDNRCCIMTPFAAGSTFGQGPTAVWSSCSKTRYHQKLVELSMANNYCLDNVVMTDPINTMPGQANPAEVQCHVLLGLCSRADPAGDQSDCGLIQCSENNGVTSVVYAVTRIDGTFCGPGKICVSGICAATETSLYPVDGGWSQWSDNSESRCGGIGCSKCSIRRQQRMRTQVRSCDSPMPNNNGKACVGNSIRAISCSETVCQTGPELNVYVQNTCSEKHPGSSPSSDQSTQCTFSCQNAGTWLGRYTIPNGIICQDSGQSGRCINGQCLFAGCQLDSEYFVATPKECPRQEGSSPECKYTQWTSWSTCSVKCGIGVSQRTRLVDKDALEEGAECLDSNLEESRVCEAGLCNIDCQYGSWTSWLCAVTCGPGVSSRGRVVLSNALNEGKKCNVDEMIEERACSDTLPCPTPTTTPIPSVDCRYSDYSPWGECTASCGSGFRVRTRVVLQSSTGGGQKCSDNELTVKQPCETKKCPVNCVLSQWGSWSACSSSCGLGESMRSRFIVTEATIDGVPCENDRLQSKRCNAVACPTNCSYSQWSAWSDCSLETSCLRTRKRTILEEGANGGMSCDYTNLLDEEKCSELSCKYECVPTPWNTWSACSKSCGPGQSVRTRNLLGDCTDNEITREETNCNLKECSEDRCIYTAWKMWGACSRTCGEGTRVRYRKILLGCENNVLSDEETCSGSPCPSSCYWTDWTEWSAECSQTCGSGGKKIRTRRILTADDNSPCGANEEEYILCILNACEGTELDCVLRTWGQWSRCSRSCGSGKRFRTRSIQRRALPGGLPCPKSGFFEFESCNNQGCPARDSPPPQNCSGLTEWESWSECSRSCGTAGVKRRKRAMIENNSDEISEFVCPLEEVAGCYSQYSCTSHCKWSNWSNWTLCNQGTRERNRYSLRDSPKQSSCLDSSKELESCT